MIHPRPRCFLLLAGLFAIILRGDLSANSTEELLQVLPRDVGGCLIVENLSSNIDKIGKSAFWRRFEKSALFEKGKQSPGFRTLAQLEALAPFYLGMTGGELRERILGQAVVLALFPATGEQERDVGVFLCRAIDADALTKLVTVVTNNGNKHIEKRTHRGVDYFAHPAGPRFLLQLGAIGAISDSEFAIQSVIDTHLDGESLGNLPEMRQAREVLPQECVAQLLINPRRFDEVLNKSLQSRKPGEQWVAQRVTNIWQSLRWVAITLRVDNGLLLGSHTCRLPSADPSDRPMIARNIDNSRFWSRVPDNTLAAAVVNIDLPVLVRLIARFTDEGEKEELKIMVNLFEQILPGYNLTQEVLPSLGPLVGLVSTAGPTAIPDLIGVMELSSDTKMAELDDRPVSMDVALEFTLRPLMALIAFEHNKEHSDQMRTSLQLKDGVRIHFLHGSRLLPEWLKPAFAVYAGFVVVGSTPESVSRWYAETSDGPLQAEIASLAPGTTLHAYLDLRGLAAHVETHGLAILEAITRGDETAAGAAGEKLAKIQSLLEMFDRVLLTSQTNGDVDHAILSLRTIE